MRGLKERFVEELLSGKLAWLLEEIKKNDDLFLSIGKNEISVFYKGVQMLHVKPGGGYTFTIQEKFFTSDSAKDEYAIFIRDKKAVSVYQRKFPTLLEIIESASTMLCGPQDWHKQNIATGNPYIIAMDYEFPADFGGITLDLLGIHQGKLVAIHHNLGQSIVRVAPVYQATERIWNHPESKQVLIQSAKNITENLQTLGLLKEPLELTQEELSFVAILTDTNSSITIPEDTLPLKHLHIDTSVIDLPL